MDNGDKKQKEVGLLKKILEHVIIKDNRVVVMHSRIDKLEEKFDKMCKEHSNFDKEIAVRLAGIDTNLEFIKETLSKKQDTSVSDNGNGKTRKMLAMLLTKVVNVVLILAIILAGLAGLKLTGILGIITNYLGIS